MWAIKDRDHYWFAILLDSHYKGKNGVHPAITEETENVRQFAFSAMAVSTVLLGVQGNINILAMSNASKEVGAKSGGTLQLLTSLTPLIALCKVAT